MLLRRVWPSRPTFDHPLADFHSVRNELMRLLESASGAPAVSGVFPPINVTQDHDNFYVRAEVPGIAASQLSISALRNRLAITGERKLPTEPGRVSYHRKERAEGTFSRSLTLPAEIDPERVDARCVDGILSVTLPKADSAKPRQIAVRS